MNDLLVELVGIIEEINADGVINEKEIQKLKSWLENSIQFRHEPSFSEIITKLIDILDDGIITDDERMILIDFVDKYHLSNNSVNNSLTVLNGIIEGIVCDEEINEQEIKHLFQWQEKHSDLKGIDLYDRIHNLINNILGDGIITSEEQEELYSVLNNHIIEAKKELKIDYLKKMVINGENIGNELISLLDDNEIVQLIHTRAKYEMRLALESYSGIGTINEQIVFISLVLIAIFCYNGNYYGSVREIYDELYGRYSQQKIEGYIRNLISKYRYKSGDNDIRIINYVLMNAIVPAAFLPDYFDFIFDIYKINFNYSLNDKLYEEFSFIFNGLKDSISTDDDLLNVNVTRKTYRLIKSTKNLILSSSNYDELINMSINVIKAIDKFYWSEEEIQINNIYYTYGLSEWKEKYFSKKDKVRSTKPQLSSRWELSFEINDKDIYLVPPVHKIRNDVNIDLLRIKIYNGDDLIYENNEVEYYEIIGGYQVQLDLIKIDSPLGKINYKLFDNKTVIYDSKDKLYREFIMFNSSGYEIKNNQDYKGIMVLCCDFDTKGRTSDYYIGENYKLSMASVNNSTVLTFDDYVLSFSSQNDFGIYGINKPGCSIRNNNKTIPVYERLTVYAFESQSVPNSIYINVNGKDYFLDNLKYECTKRDAYYKYIISLDFLDSDIYKIYSYTINNDKIEKGKSYEFALDKSLNYESIKLNNNEYRLKIKSSFFDDKEHVVNIKDMNDFKVLFGENEKYQYIIPFEYMAYLINEECYSFSDSMWIGDVYEDTLLTVLGLKCLKIRVVSDDEREVTSLFPTKGKNNTFNIGELKKYKEKYKYLQLKIVDKDDFDKEIRCYNQFSINEHMSRITYNSSVGILDIELSTNGKADLYVDIYNDNEYVITKRTVDEKHTLIGRLPSFLPHTIDIYLYDELGNKIIIYTKNMIFYSFLDFEKRNYRLATANYEMFGKSDGKEDHLDLISHLRLKRTYVRILKKIGDKEFKAILYRGTNDGAQLLDELNPVKLEVIGEIKNDRVEVSITKDDDGLLLDEKNRTIYNNLDNMDAIDIYSFYMELKR